MNFKKKKPETNHLRLSLQPLTVATSRSWRGWVAAGSTESVSGKNKKTERGGFEPPKAFDLTRLPIVHLRPLGHLSNSTANYIRKAFDSSSSASKTNFSISFWCEKAYFSIKERLQPKKAAPERNQNICNGLMPYDIKLHVCRANQARKEKQNNRKHEQENQH